MNILKAIRKTYTACAVITFTTILLLSLATAALLLYESVKGVEIRQANPRIYSKMIARNAGDLQKVYPALKTEEIQNLLFETWTRPYIYEPFTQFRERPYSGKYVYIDPNGFRKVLNQKIWPPVKSNFNIFMFGGSTLFGYGISNEDTIASYLGKSLENMSEGMQIAVYNFGRGFYYSTQERILYEQLLTEGHVPNLAIFFDGLNEFYNSSNQPMMTDRLSKIINKPIKKTMFTQMTNDLKQKAFSYYNYHKLLIESSDIEKQIYGNAAMKERVVNNYLQNMRIISAVSMEYNVTPLFVWQPVPTYKYDLKYHVFSNEGFDSHLASMPGYQHMRNIVSSNSLKENFLWLADIQEGIQEPLYVDLVHYTAEFSKLLANEMATYITEQRLLETH